MRVRRASALIAALVGSAVVVVAAWPARSSRSAQPVVSIVGAPTEGTATADGGGEERAVGRPQDAAVRYVLATRALMADGPIGRREVLRHLMTADGYLRASGPVDASIDALESQLRDAHDLPVPAAALTWIEAPLTVRVDTIGPDSARCEVWTMSVFGAQRLGDPQAAWRTVTLELRRERGRWLIDNATSGPGPAPSTSASAGIADFEQFAHVAGAQPVVGAAG